MRVHFFLVTSSACATYLWSNMADPGSCHYMCIPASGTDNNTPFGSDISPVLKFHWLKNLPRSCKPGGGGHTEGQGKVILLKNIHDE